MSSTSVPQRRRRTSTSQRCANATTKAETLIVDYYLDGDTLIIASETTPGHLYVVTSKECTCPAGRAEWPCKHAAYRLDMLRPRSTPQTDADYKTTVDVCDELR